ncbi:GumC family protein [Calothrix sp. 336/3]|uniref:GumC family protein n=1 Tax=Calothrix sp. 336/3 TaxID=1337936 RepID=UPI0004E45A4F|nr:tyrosine-protein kinase domain-containing protein [Calothrix sp. 336/3]AKG20935.1 capsular biosynthesis protein [Calothrix sp. 336/3]
MLKSDRYLQPLSPSQAIQFNQGNNDGEEGGLNLGQVGATLRRRALLVVGITGVVATAAVLKAKTDPPAYQGSFEILTEPVTGESKAIANVPQTLGSVTAPESSTETTIQVLQSRRVLNPVIKELQAKYQQKYPEMEFTYESIVGGLNIASKKQNVNILEVEYISPNEEITRDFLSAVARAYLNYSLAERRNDVEQAIKFVEQQRVPLEQRVKMWQERLRAIRQQNNLVDPASRSQEISTQINVFTQQRIENRVQLEQMVSKYQDLQKELTQQPGAAASFSILSENARYQKILDQIQSIDADIAKRGSIFTNQEEGMQRLAEQKSTMIGMLDTEKARVNRDFQSRIQELRARDASLEDKINNLNSYLRALAAVNRDYDNIQQELKIANDALTQFTSKQQALRIEYAQRLQPWRSLDPEFTKVQKPEAVSDSAKRNLALGGLLGLLLGTGAALVVDKLSNVFYTSKDLKEATGLPLLGVVPLRKELAVKKQDSLAAGLPQAARASFFEVFRSLYTNILLLGSDSPIRSLVISSADQGDGKSTVAIHLALAAAAMGQRVLLVDANLRFPSLHQRVGLMNIQGLTDVISADLDWSNVIERSPLEDNLYLMSAGPIPPDSVRLLASQKMQDLMNEMHDSFDLVIYDTPPVVGFADANLLAANTNGMVLVAGLGKLKRTMFQQALEEMQISGTPLLGMIANKSKEAAPAAYSYYQQYYRQTMSAERITGDKDSVEASVPKVK